MLPIMTYIFSERKWKMKLKEWGFNRYMRAKDMSIVIAKVEKRREEGIETEIFHGETLIHPERLETFKKRKATKVNDVESPSAGKSPLLVRLKP
jgi:hypothetical protein